MENRTYVPDFIVAVDDGEGRRSPESGRRDQGVRGEDAKDKKLTMDSFWVPGVNSLGTFGRWAFAEFQDVLEMRSDFEDVLKIHLDHVIRFHAGDPARSRQKGSSHGRFRSGRLGSSRKRPWEIGG